MNVSLVVNPVAGGKAHKSVGRLRGLLTRCAHVNECITESKGDAYEFVNHLQPCDRLIVAGGDGTNNEVINGMMDAADPAIRDIPLALIPLGTTNVLAKDRKIPEDIADAVELAINGTPHRIALGRLNGRYFITMAGIGFDAEAVHGVKQGLVKKISGKAAHIVSGLKVLRHYDPPLIHIKTPELEIEGHTVIIGNAKNYGGYFHVTPEADIEQPVFDVCVLGGRRRRDLLRFVGGIMTGRHTGFHDVRCLQTSELELTSEGRVHTQVDGDYLGILPGKVIAVGDALNLVW